MYVLCVLMRAHVRAAGRAAGHNLAGAGQVRAAYWAWSAGAGYLRAQFSKSVRVRGRCWLHACGYGAGAVRFLKPVQTSAVYPHATTSLM